ncbi:MAG TPA: hypothetical protein VIN59_04105 [Alphaproteobacteria bacterium]
MSFSALFNRNADFVGNRYENAADNFAFDHPNVPVLPSVLWVGGMMLDGALAFATAAVGIDLQNVSFSAAGKTLTDADREKITEQLSKVSPHDYFDEPKTYGDFKARMIRDRAERNSFKVIGMALTGA